MSSYLLPTEREDRHNPVWAGIATAPLRLVGAGRGDRSRPMSGPRPPVVDLGGAAVTLMEETEAVQAIAARAGGAGSDRPLAVVSANLDHLHHFGLGSRWQGVLEQADAEGCVEVLTLLDGMPLVHRATRMTGTAWPRLAGSDLIGPLLDRAEEDGLRVGFLGGAPQTHQELARLLAASRPRLRITGWWAPERSTLGDHEASAALAAEVAATGVDLLVVGMGKPRQELWIAEHGAATGAGALLAFGAVVDFLADRVNRAPSWISQAGLEWSYRLIQEPRRLSRRYLIDGPEAYHALRRHSHVLHERAYGAQLNSATHTALRGGAGLDRAPGPGPAVRRHRPVGVDLTAVLVTYNSAAHVDRVLDDLQRTTSHLRTRVLVVDNGSTDGTVALLRAREGVTVLRAPGNLGYAGGINHALARMESSRAVLVLNPDLALEDGAVQAMWRRLWQEGVGAVAPRTVGPDGSIRRSLRFEPTMLRTWGDALLGDRAARRPTWATETDHEPESYCHPHPVDWATGSCLLVRGEVVDRLGGWDERYFLYSEEVDYLRRVREAGWSVWFEPAAVVRHDEGGSGRNPELAALQAVNRVRYAESVHGRGLEANVVRAGVLVAALLRLNRGPEHRVAAARLASRRRWSQLPRAVRRDDAGTVPQLRTWGSVVVPAHQEGAVIGRTLEPLAPLAAEGRVEVVVAANGCTDDTVEVAKGRPGVTVLDLPASSKAHALNDADAITSAWPRLYLDADITVTGEALAELFAAFDDESVLAARPSFRYETAGACWLVKRYYAARMRLPEHRSHLWGAGAYAVSEAGHERFGAFPLVAADDLFVDASFDPAEKRVVDTEPVVVRTPTDTSSLLKVMRRSRGGVEQLSQAAIMDATTARRTATTNRTLTQLVRSVRSPGSLVDAAVYAGLTAVARTQSRRRGLVTWERDESSRARVG